MSRKRLDPSTTQVAAALLLLAACGLPARWASGWTERVRDVLQNDRPNAADYERLEHSYYERIAADPKARRPFDAGVLGVVVEDAREYVLKPNLSTLHKGARWTTNEHGRRDRPRAVAKPAGVFRVALLGDSIGAGWGVNDEETFTRVLEQTFATQGRAVEVLNFASPGHAPGQRWEDFLRGGFRFEPDLVLFEGTTADVLWDERRIRAFVARGLGADSPIYGDLIRSLRLGPELDPDEIKARLAPVRDRILPSVYRKVAADCRAKGIPCVGLLLPRVGRPASVDERSRMARWATEAGFDAWFDLTDAFDGLDPADLAIAPDDYHPDAKGHALLARRIEHVLNSTMPSRPRPNMEGGSR